MLGLKRGTVMLLPHQEEWCKNAENIILLLKQILGNTAIDIQHIGSTAIFAIHAKPIIDIVVGVCDLNDIAPYSDLLKNHAFVFHKEAVDGEMLFVRGDLVNDLRTHHIHIVKWGEKEWNNYLNFRDYLNAFPEKAMVYDNCKQKLSLQFSNDRKSYTAGKKEIINCLLDEAEQWKSEL